MILTVTLNLCTFIKRKHILSVPKHWALKAFWGFPMLRLRWVIGKNTLWNLNKYTLHFGHTSFDLKKNTFLRLFFIAATPSFSVIGRNTLCNLNKYTLQFGQIYGILKIHLWGFPVLRPRWAPEWLVKILQTSKHCNLDKYDCDWQNYSLQF